MHVAVDVVVVVDDDVTLADDDANGEIWRRHFDGGGAVC